MRVKAVDDLQPITTGDKELEYANWISYLEFQIDREGSSTADINSRLGKAQSTFNCKLMNSKSEFRQDVV